MVRKIRAVLPISILIFVFSGCLPSGEGGEVDRELRSDGFDQAPNPPPSQAPVIRSLLPPADYSSLPSAITLPPEIIDGGEIHPLRVVCYFTPEFGLGRVNASRSQAGLTQIRNLNFGIYDNTIDWNNENLGPLDYHDSILFFRVVMEDSLPTTIEWREAREVGETHNLDTDAGLEFRGVYYAARALTIHKYSQYGPYLYGEDWVQLPGETHVSFVNFRCFEIDQDTI